MTSLSPSTPAELDLLQRVVLPSDHDPDVVPLYVDADYWSSIPVADHHRRTATSLASVDADVDRAVVRLSDMGLMRSSASTVRP
jgi:galactofuranosylgalactofuranosylrhamnosyl-N-acetylglucosaminyl-diphospho-decaprenol beta-1,5/1,6-galactofuranosyltransferase